MKQAVAQVADELRALDEKHDLLKTEFETEHATISDQIGEKNAAKATADDAWVVKRNKLREAESQLEHFEGVNVEQLNAEQSSEEALKSKKLSVRRELEELEAATGGLSVKASDQRATITNQFTKDSGDISKRRLEVVRSTQVNSQKLHETETAALGALASPPRLIEIAASKIEVASRLGELRSLIANPRASQETLEEQRLAIADVDRLREGLAKASEQVAAANDLLTTATWNSNNSLEKVRRLESDCETLSTRRILA